MNGVLNDLVKTTILDVILANAPFAGSNCKMMLFDTIAALDHATLLATLAAHEVSVAGYARQTVSGWSAAALTADFHARSQASTVTFTNSSGGATGSITGWALVDTAGGKVIEAALYDTPFVIGAGQSYLTTPFWVHTGEVSTEP